MNKDSLIKAWDYIVKAQLEVCLKFTGDKDCDAIVNKVYDMLEDINKEIGKTIKKME